MRGHQQAAQHLAARRNAEPTRSGTVFKKLLGHYWVNIADDTIVCSISSRLRKVLIYPVADTSSLHPRVQSVEEIAAVDPVAIGDIVGVADAPDGSGVITDVFERKNALLRRAAGPKPLEQVIVANVDQIVCVMAAAQPAPSWELLDRYLVAAEATDIPAMICITKADLMDQTMLAAELAAYEQAGYRVLLTSAATGTGIDAFRSALHDRVSVLTGKSGVGKTSLLNSVQPELGLRINEVSGKTGKGKHTTTHLEMFALAAGGSVVDTPGMREFGLWNVGERELASLFPEMRPYLGACKFGADCSHNHEPGCAIKAAVASGTISAGRHQSYLKLRKG